MGPGPPGFLSRYALALLTVLTVIVLNLLSALDYEFLNFKKFFSYFAAVFIDYFTDDEVSNFRNLGK